MSTSNTDSLYIFIDKDDKASTGYSIRGMGADYMIEVYGWESTIGGLRFGVFTGTDQNDWNSWRFGGEVTAALEDNQIEIKVDYTNLNDLGDNYKSLFLTSREGEIGEICNAQVAEGKGALFRSAQCSVQIL